MFSYSGREGCSGRKHPRCWRRKVIKALARQNIALVSFAAVILLLPVVLGSGFYLNIMISIAIYSMTAIGLCLLIGYAGQLSLVHASFFGIGAYMSGILTSRLGFPPVLALLASIVVVGAVACLVGLVVLRFKSHYLFIVTLSLLTIIEILLKELVSLTGGVQGLSGIPRFSLGGWIFDNELKIYYLDWVILLCIAVFSLNLTGSKIGRALRATKEGEGAARLMGIRVFRYKTKIFVLSSVYAVIAGSLYAHYTGFITPQVASLVAAFEMIVMVAFGGFTSIWGAICGVAGISFLSEYLRPFADYKLAIFGLALVIIMFFFPNGLLQGVKDLVSRIFIAVWRANLEGRQGARASASSPSASENVD
jgi:branched-chain amino acid transport system permease protein